MPQVTRYEIEQWIKTIPTGEFHYKEVLNGEIASESYGKLRKIMYDITHASEPICESVGKRDGYYRPIQDKVLPVDWQNVEAKKDFPVVLPFDLRKYVFIYPNTAIVVAGSKSSGKTGFLYRTVVLNMDKNVILLTNMEGGKEQMRDRMCAITDIKIPYPAPFTIYPVYDNFHDFIKKPNTLYIIDYIDAPEGTDFFLIGGAITKIRKKLVDSVAVIGLQKPYGRDTAFGGEQTLKEAALYIAMDTGKLKIVDAKVPADKKIHPKNMQWTFTYSEEGTRFDDIKPYYGG